jgi:hypothetical protein
MLEPKQNFGARGLRRLPLDFFQRLAPLDNVVAQHHVPFKVQGSTYSDLPRTA